MKINYNIQKMHKKKLYKAANSHIIKKPYNMTKKYHHLLEALNQTWNIFNNLKDFPTTKAQNVYFLYTT